MHTLTIHRNLNNIYIHKYIYKIINIYRNISKLFFHLTDHILTDNVESINVSGWAAKPRILQVP